MPQQFDMTDELSFENGVLVLSGYTVAPTAAGGNLLLLETGSPDNLLLETGDNLLLE